MVEQPLQKNILRLRCNEGDGANPTLERGLQARKRSAHAARPESEPRASYHRVPGKTRGKLLTTQLMPL